MKRDILIDYINFIQLSKYHKMMFGGYFGYTIYRIFKGKK